MGFEGGGTGVRPCFALLAYLEREIKPARSAPALPQSGGMGRFRTSLPRSSWRAFRPRGLAQCTEAARARAGGRALAGHHASKDQSRFSDRGSPREISSEVPGLFGV